MPARGRRRSVPDLPPKKAEFDTSSILDLTDPTPAQALPMQSRVAPFPGGIRSLADCFLFDRKDYLWKGIIHRGDLGYLYGKSGSYKSFLAIYFGLHFAQGGETMQSQRTKFGRTLYVNLEQPWALRERSAAALTKLGGKANWDDPLSSFDGYVPGMEDSFSTLDRDVDAFSTEGLAILRGMILAWSSDHGLPDFIILDTMNQTCPGMKESDSGDAAMFQRGLRQLGHELGNDPAFMIVTHVPKANGPPSIRGSTAHYDGADFVLCCERVTSKAERGSALFPVVKVTLTPPLGKTKSSRPLGPFHWSLHEISLGVDEEGDRVSSLKPLEYTTDEASEAAMASQVVAQTVCAACHSELVAVQLLCRSENVAAQEFDKLCATLVVQTEAESYLSGSALASASGINRNKVGIFVKAAADEGLAINQGTASSGKWMASPGLIEALEDLKHIAAAPLHKPAQN